MAELQNTESTSPVQAKDTRVYYNYGDQKIDLKHYIHNLDSNLERFLSTRTNWSSEQKDAFKSKYAQLKQGLEDQLATGNDRFSTDFNGITTDSVGEIANGQDLLYLDGSDDYDGAFDVSKELGKYIDKIGGTIVLQGYTKDYYDKLFQAKLKQEEENTKNNQNDCAQLINLKANQNNFGDYTNLNMGKSNKKSIKDTISTNSVTFYVEEVAIKFVEDFGYKREYVFSFLLLMLFVR